MEMYKKASKIGLRVATKYGELNVEQLWNLKLKELDAIAVLLEDEYDKSGKKSFLEKATKKDETTKLALDIVVDILKTKVEIAESRKERSKVDAQIEYLLELKEAKQNEEDKQLSISDIDKRIEELRNTME